MDRVILDATRDRAPVRDGGAAGSRYTVSLGNTPLIAHVLDELAGVGIARARVIASPGRAESLRSAIRSATAGTPQVTVEEAADGTERRAVLEALAAALVDGPALLHPADALYGDGLGAMLARYGRGDVDVALAVTAGQDSAPGALDENAIVVGPDARDLLHSLAAHGPDGEQPAAAMLHSDLRLAVCDLPARWAYDDSTEALLAGNRLVLDGLPADPVIDDGAAEGNELHGRIALGRDTFISGCVVHGPVAIADGAVLEDSFVGPYTSIGAGAVVSGAEIDNAMVLARAEIRHPGQRIVASILGEDARVGRSFGLPRGIHLRLAPGSQVTFS